jgi:hypothetical protein
VDPQVEQWLTNSRLTSWLDYATWFILIALIIVSELMLRLFKAIIVRVRRKEVRRS